MRVAVAAQSWPLSDTESLTPERTAVVVRDAWAQAAPHVDLDVRAVPDGGPLTGAALTYEAVVGDAWPVGGALARRIRGAVVLSPARGVRWEPGALASALWGLAAAGESATVIVPVGDDAPAGDAVDLWGGGLAAARAALAGLDIVALVGADRPLLGFHGMSAAVREGREADSALALAAQAQEERWSAIAREADPVASRKVLMGVGRLSDEPGAGAAGGLAYALAALGARLAPGSRAVAEMVGVDDAAAGADLVVAVVSRLRAADLDHGAAAAAAWLAGRRGAPCVVATGHLGVGRRDLMAGGIAGAHEGESGEDGLAAQVRRLAHTWTPLR